ncbi:MAG: diguanylate cyclase [Leptospiraceae bacterium]|nr:diguanylate cyclase [Leptospiraceae bacterium]
MSFIEKALKLLQEFPNLKNEPFQLKDKKKKSFLQEAENFFRNLTGLQSQPENENVNSEESIDIDLDSVTENQDYPELTLPTEEVSNSEKNPEQIEEYVPVQPPLVPDEFDEEDEIIVDLDLEDDSSLVEEKSNQENSALEVENEETVEVESIQDFQDSKPEILEEFSGDTETLELEEQPPLSSLIDELENEIEELKNDIELEEEDTQVANESSVLEDWEKDAMAESSSEPFLEDEDPNFVEPNLPEDNSQEVLTELENSEPDPSEPIVGLNVEEAFDTAKQFKSSYEEKLESYLVLFEITKELLKSKSFDDFFENLMYSIIGQVGPEIMIIFSSRDGNFSQMKIVAFEGIDIEPDYVIKKGDTLYSLLESEHDVVYAKDLLNNELKERERVLLGNPLTEILIPIRVMDQFCGFIVAGKMISGEDYTEKDFEFLQILVEVSGNFLSKLFDSENLSNEVSELNKIIHATSNITEFTDKVYACKSLDELYDAISENFLSDFKVSSFTLMVLDTKNLDYKVFGSNFLLPDTLGKLRLSKDSKIITMISQVSDVYRLENFQSNGELNNYISEDELLAMNEFTVIPLINIGRMVGLIIIHKVSTEWSPGYKRTILSLANIAAPIIANLIMQNEQETLFRNPFNPLQETIDREIKYCDSKQKQFTLIVLKILNVTRILNILGINFFSEYSEFISKKIFENTKPSDYVSRIGQGKFAILLKENSKSDSEAFISKIKSEIVMFHNPSRDFKLSIQIYALTYPEQAKEKRKFIEMMEET